MINYKQLSFVLAGLAVVGSAFFFTKQYANAAEAKDGAEYGHWVMRCASSEKDNNKICFLVQALQHEGENEKGEKRSRVVAAYQVGYFEEDQKLRIVEILPLGVSLPAGTSIISGGKLLVHGKYNVCTTEGCRASAELTKDDLKVLMSSTTNEVGFLDAKGNQVNLPISFDGLTEGLKVLKPGKKKKTK